MKKSSLDFLEDMVESIKKGEIFLSGISFDDFMKDEKTQYAIIRVFEIIGEAAGKVSDEIKAEYPDVPWKEMSGMRNKLIHDYFGVNEEVVWKTALEDLPKLKMQIENILNNLK